MKNLIRISLLFLVAVGSVFGQTNLTLTTLSAAVADGSTRIVVVASATGITAPASGTTTTELYIDNEAMIVNAISGTTLTVQRGASGTPAKPHLSGSLVFIGPPKAFPATKYDPSGSCTRTTIPYVPIINLDSGNISDCLGGVYVNGLNQPLQNALFRVLAPNSGGTAYTALGGTGTVPAATTMYCTEVDLPANKYATGIGVMNGTVVGTDNHLVALYDAGGVLIANSAVAGVLAASASTYQTIAFTAPKFLVGPAQYFGCVQTNGTTATIRMIASGTQDTFLTKGVTGITFGTIPATIVVPTTFTTAVGPYVFVY